MVKILFTIMSALIITACADCQEHSENSQISGVDTIKSEPPIVPGAEQPEQYLGKLSGKRVGLVVNQSSLVHKSHLVDFLLKNRINVIKIFALEHGFRGNIDRGGHVLSENDEKTGIPIVSLFGKNKRPTNEQLENLDVIIFDIQDVGARFFTYISSMYEIMDACATNSKLFLIFDRPNPLGDYVDGPVLNLKYKSFVGMFPIPVVHGLTVGELALMINGEKWLKNGKTCKLEIIKVLNYKHSDKYVLPVKPSPNLPNYLSVRLYPSLCFFEGTVISIGRGTEFPFQVIGYPNPALGDSLFVPKDIPGMQMDPEHEGEICYGLDLRNQNHDSIKFTLKYLIDFYNKFPDNEKFFSRPNWINTLAGNNQLIQQIRAGLTEEEIKASWKEDLGKYKEMRKKYLLYAEK